jgi:hypothetical protein
MFPHGLAPTNEIFVDISGVRGQTEEKRCQEMLNLA